MLVIAWETEDWTSDSLYHMIICDGVDFVIGF